MSETSKQTSFSNSGNKRNKTSIHEATVILLDSLVLFWLAITGRCAVAKQVAQTLLNVTPPRQHIKFVAAFPKSLRKVELDSMSWNLCCNESIARQVHFRVCYTNRFLVQHVSQQNCETLARKIAQ